MFCKRNGDFQSNLHHCYERFDLRDWLPLRESYEPHAKALSAIPAVDVTKIRNGERGMKNKTKQIKNGERGHGSALSAFLVKKIIPLTIIYFWFRHSLEKKLTVNFLDFLPTTSNSLTLEWCLTQLLCRLNQLLLFIIKYWYKKDDKKFQYETETYIML